MDYTSIHIYGHLLSDDVLRSIEQDSSLIGNREQDYGIDTSITYSIDFVWSSLRSAYSYYKERSTLNDPYGTRRSRDLMERLLGDLGYDLQRQITHIQTSAGAHNITYLCPALDKLPIIVEGDKTGETDIDTLDKCSLDFRAKGERRRKSPHATMLQYLNSTESIYGIVANGRVMRLIRNSGQLVKLTYIEFDLVRMLEEDKYTEFCLMFRLMHASRFRHSGDEQTIIDRYFNLSIESGNRIRNGLSKAVQQAMEVIGTAIVTSLGEGNDRLRAAINEGTFTADDMNKELIHFIYRLLFLFIIEDRNLVYQIPDIDSPSYKQQVRFQDIYKKYYAASRLRQLSELNYLRQQSHNDLWQGLMETFRLFETNGIGERLGIKPLGGVLFGEKTLYWLKQCTLSNRAVLEAFAALNVFIDEHGSLVKINYSSLNVEEFGSVYEGILEMRPSIEHRGDASEWKFRYVSGFNRQSTSSYYTRPDLVQNLIRTTLEPVIKERIKKLATPEEKVKSLLSMKVCDAASGSGHIVLAMARTIAWYVCSIRTGEDNPASLDYREALREVIQKCIYAVDYNPDAVELCKVVLWIEGYCAEKPLSFLDHHIRCGNSVLGVSDLRMLINGVPDKAFTTEDNETKRSLLSFNREAIRIVTGKKEAGTLELEDSFGITEMDTEQIGLAQKAMLINSMPENTIQQEEDKQQYWINLMKSARVDCLRRACDIYTYAFFRQVKHNEIFEGNNIEHVQQDFEVPYSKTVFRAIQEIDAMECLEKGQPLPKYYVPLSSNFKTEVCRFATAHRPFHWCIEFPDVFANGGFDVMCGNPPWDKIKVESKKWFESKERPDIVNVGTAAQRKKAIAKLETNEPTLFYEYVQALQDAEGLSRFVRFSNRFNLTATGDIDLYPMFGELYLTFSKDAWGLVMPTGIAVNDSNKTFFSKLIDDNRLMSLYDFENRELIFDIHRMSKFCLLTAGKAQSQPRTVQGGFYLTRLDHLLDPNRIYTLQTDDFTLLNPNTKTCPTFRTSRDAKLTSKIYQHTKVLINETTGENPWNVHFARMLDMSNDSHLFRTYAQLKNAGATIEGNKFTLNGNLYVPLYEGKMIWHYNHHYGTWPTNGERPNNIPTPTAANCCDPDSYIMPWYWVPQSVVNDKLTKYDKDGNIVWQWKHKWLLGFRDITNATNERTFIMSPIPDACGVGNSATLLIEERGTMPGALLLGMMSSLPFDYTTRQKIGGSHASISFVKQFPVLSPEQIPDWAEFQIVSRVAELCYFNHDLDGWMDELWHDEKMTDELRTLIVKRLKECNHLQFSGLDFSNIQPFIYNEDRRTQAQAELDVIFAHLYGLTTEELYYILDPEDICGTGCINETFRVLKDNETRKYGEYRTKRLVIEAWEKFEFDN